MSKQEHDRQRRKAEVAYPLRLIFDDGLPRLYDMHQMADEAWAFTNPPHHRMAFYFATLDKMLAFIDEFGPGRTMGPHDGNPTRRNIGTFGVSIELPK